MRHAYRFARVEEDQLRAPRTGDLHPLAVAALDDPAHLCIEKAAQVRPDRARGPQHRHLPRLPDKGVEVQVQQPLPLGEVGRVHTLPRARVAKHHNSALSVFHRCPPSKP